MKIGEIGGQNHFWNGALVKIDNNFESGHLYGRPVFQHCMYGLNIYRPSPL